MKPGKPIQRIYLIFGLLFFSSCSLPISQNVLTPLPTGEESMVIPPIATETRPVDQATQPPASTPSLHVLTPIPTTTLSAQYPTQTVSPTPLPAQGTPPSSGRNTYAVAFIGEGDVLSVHNAPGSAAPVISTIDPGTNTISLTGQETLVDDQRWVEVRLGFQTLGWVDDYYLTEYVDPNSFCLDKRVDVLVGKMIEAISSQDGKLLVSIISPKHGLFVTEIRGGAVINYDAAHAPWVFTSTYEIDWGLHPGSGMPVRGSFSKIVLPDLLDVFDSSYTRKCENIAAGGATYTATWPREYLSINMISFYRPGPAGKELDWRSWLVGIEYSGGNPYLVALYQLTWEP